jgi:FixJ family two-component response regulator
MWNSRSSRQPSAAIEPRLSSLAKSVSTGRASSQSSGTQEPTIFIIDDDGTVREALQNLLESVHLRTEVFSSSAEFLGSTLPDVASCLVLDIRLPGMSGLDFQAQLARANVHIPIIFMTGHGDIPMTVRAMKAGAVDFLTKPFRDQDMLDAIAMAIEHDRKRRKHEKQKAELRAIFETLTPREREIMILVTSGLMNKHVAEKTGLAETTAKIHRGNVMRKMGAKSLADLVRMAEILKLHKDHS